MSSARETPVAVRNGLEEEEEEEEERKGKEGRGGGTGWVDTTPTVATHSKAEQKEGGRAIEFYREGFLSLIGFLHLLLSSFLKTNARM